MDGTGLLIRSDLICGQTFYIWRYVGPAIVLSGAIRPRKKLDQLTENFILKALAILL